MKDFSKDILHTIEQEQISPLPRWVFFMRQVLLIGAFLFSVIIGAISVSVMLFFLSDAVDTGMGNMVQVHLGQFMMTYLPYAWMAIMVLFGVFAYFEMRNTKTGYRYRTATILGISFFASFVLGGFLYAAGAGQFVDSRVAVTVPMYRGLDARKMHLWMHPNDGMLAGEILSKSDASGLIIKDFSGEQWSINAIGVQVSRFNVGDRIRISGSILSPGVFRATGIFPWNEKGMMEFQTRSQTDTRPFEGGGMMRERKNAMRAY